MLIFVGILKYGAQHKFGEMIIIFVFTIGKIVDIAKCGAQCIHCEIKSRMNTERYKFHFKIIVWILVLVDKWKMAPNISLV